jgi:hypothetical protein
MITLNKYIEELQTSVADRPWLGDLPVVVYEESADDMGIEEWGYLQYPHYGILKQMEMVDGSRFYMTVCDEDDELPEHSFMAVSVS